MVGEHKALLPSPIIGILDELCIFTSLDYFQFMLKFDA